MATLTQFQPLLKKSALALGAFLVLAGGLYLVLTKTSGPGSPPPNLIQSSDFLNPPEVEGEGQLRLGSVYRLKGKGELYAWGAIQEVVVKNPDPQTLEAELFLFPNLEETSILLNQETTLLKPLQEEGQIKSAPAQVSDLKKDRWVKVTYEISDNKIRAIEIALVM